MTRKTLRFADEERVDAWIAEHRPIVDDPEAGAGVLQRVVSFTVDEVLALGEELQQALASTTDATKEYGKAQSNPGTTPGALLILDKKRKALGAESERLQALYDRFGAFFEEASARYHAAAKQEARPRSEVPVSPPSPLSRLASLGRIFRR